MREPSTMQLLDVQAAVREEVCRLIVNTCWDCDFEIDDDAVERIARAALKAAMQESIG